MNESRERSLILLGRGQAVVSGVLTLGTFAFLALRPEHLQDAGVPLAMAILGAVSVAYFATLHQVLSRTRLALSTLILTIMTAINLVLLIATTGGLDSPYYSLWLLAIVVAGIFGAAETGIVVILTATYYTYALVIADFRGPYVRDHLVQLMITIIAAAIAEWVHSRSRKVTAAQSHQLASLSGQLTQEQLKAQALMGAIAEGVLVVDTARQIQLFNKAASQLTGWDEASAQGINYNLVLKLRTSDDQEVTDTNDPFATAWTTLQPVVADDLVMTTRAGRKIQLNISVSPITDAANRPTGAIALFRDISREKAVERQKDEFVSTASHEMRTPVAAIEGYISLAMNANVATIDDRAQKYLGKAHDTIQHLGELFRDLLSVTKAEEGKLNSHTEAVSLSDLVEHAVEDMQFAAQKRHLTLVFQSSHIAGKAISPLYYAMANPERLREVVMNLIDNALKYTQEGGVTVSVTGDTHDVVVSVADTGVGIAAEDMGHLFQKFYRVDNSATRTIGGTGLGLYLCRTMVELWNGRIWLESKPGEGSTFKISLPRVKEAEAQPAATPGTPVAASGAALQPSQDPASLAPQPVAMPVMALHNEPSPGQSHRIR